jgi:hypothetical protein
MATNARIGAEPRELRSPATSTVAPVGPNEGPELRRERSIRLSYRGDVGEA